MLPLNQAFASASDQKGCILLAIQAFKLGHIKSLQVAAAAYDITYTTFYYQINGMPSWCDSTSNRIKILSTWRIYWTGLQSWNVVGRGNHGPGQSDMPKTITIKLVAWHLNTTKHAMAIYGYLSFLMNPSHPLPCLNTPSRQCSFRCLLLSPLGSFTCHFFRIWVTQTQLLIKPHRYSGAVRVFGMVTATAISIVLGLLRLMPVSWFQLSLHLRLHLRLPSLWPRHCRFNPTCLNNSIFPSTGLIQRRHRYRMPSLLLRQCNVFFEHQFPHISS